MSNEEYDASTADKIMKLTEDEPRTCSIAIHDGEGNGMVLDQSLDVTAHGDPVKAREAIDILFPITVKADAKGEDATYGLNREILQGLDECRDVRIRGDYMAQGWSKPGYEVKVELYASHDPRDIGYLMNAFRLVGAGRYFTKGQEDRQGFKPFRKKPIVIKAKQMLEEFEVDTLEGKMKGKAGDYLIIGIKDERYPCDKEIFERSYEAADHGKS